MVLTSDQTLGLAGLIGVTASTAFVFTNSTTASLMANALILPPKNPENWLSQESSASGSAWHLARQWSHLEAWAHQISMPALLASVSSFVYAALNSPAAGAEAEAGSWPRLLFFSSAGANFACIPFTLLFMVRKNSELKHRATCGKAKDLANMDTRSLIENVSVIGRIRALLPLVSVLLGAIALVA